MKLTPKTIQIYLPGGDPRGIRIAEVTTRIVQVIEVPRSLLGEFLKMPESGQVALYFLFGQTPESDESVYIGQTGDVAARLTDHNRKKEFWGKVLIVISRTNSLTQTHAVYLEWLSIKTSRETNRYPSDTRRHSSVGYRPN
jgi:predicted GIY-YIG superfamily endonuclease